MDRHEIIKLRVDSHEDNIVGWEDTQVILTGANLTSISIINKLVELSQKEEWEIPVLEINRTLFVRWLTDAKEDYDNLNDPDENYYHNMFWIGRDPAKADWCLEYARNVEGE